MVSIYVRWLRKWDSVAVLKCAVYVLKLVRGLVQFDTVGTLNLVLTGMYALRERRQHVTQEDFEFAVAKVLKKNQEGNTSVNKLFS